MGALRPPGKRMNASSLAWSAGGSGRAASATGRRNIAPQARPMRLPVRVHQTAKTEPGAARSPTAGARLSCCADGCPHGPWLYGRANGRNEVRYTSRGTQLRVTDAVTCHASSRCRICLMGRTEACDMPDDRRQRTSGNNAKYINTIRVEIGCHSASDT
jgi:hypothetical protein